MYDCKTEGYFKHIRTELLDMIPNELKEKTVLELGAGSGETLCYAKSNGYASKIIGYDICKISKSLTSQTKICFSPLYSKTLPKA